VRIKTFILIILEYVSIVGESAVHDYRMRWLCNTVLSMQCMPFSRTRRGTPFGYLANFQVAEGTLCKVCGEDTRGKLTSHAEGQRFFEDRMTEKKALSELGCLLGAFRDVAFSIGVEIMAVTLIPRDTSKFQAKAGQSSLPKGRPRKTLKLMALIQTFGDNMLHVGYVLSQIDMQPVSAAKAVGRKEWTMRVTIGEEEVAVSGNGDVNAAVV